MESSKTTCAIDACARLPEIREWCRYHYGVLYRANQLPPRAAPSRRIADVDMTAMECTCPAHGAGARLRVRYRHGRVNPEVSCRLCDTEASRRTGSREARRASRKRNYQRNHVRYARETNGFDPNFSKDDFDSLMEAQGGVCAICGAPPKPNRRLSIDHDHDTAKVRGLLCTACNWALGRFRDDPVRFDRAAEYLRAAG